MQTIKALSLTDNVDGWLANTRQPRVLHVFDNACNLINEHMDVLSIVVQQIGNGPLYLVVEEINFTDHMNAQSDISIDAEHIQVGNLTINVTDAILWNSRPDWALLHRMKDDVLDRLKIIMPSIQPALPASLLSTFATSIAANDIPASVNAAQNLAGLGQGLTPSGDDYIMGALYAAWIIHPLEITRELAEEIAETATPLTTSLSAAWIRSVGWGDAGEIWHRLFYALAGGDKAQLQRSIENILVVGETSGADALAGFIGVCIAYKERIIE